MLGDFMVSSGQQLRAEKEIVSKDGETGGTEEVVVMDRIAYEDARFMLIVEAKRSSLLLRKLLLKWYSQILHSGSFFFFFKESLIVFSLSRL